MNKVSWAITSKVELKTLKKGELFEYIGRIYIVVGNTNGSMGTVRLDDGHYNSIGEWRSGTALVYPFRGNTLTLEAET